MHSAQGRGLPTAAGRGRSHTARAVADTGQTALALLGGARIDPAWRREFVMQAAVRDAPSGFLVHVRADEWDLVPDVRERAAGAVTRGLCDLCGAACAGDLTHVLFACPSGPQLEEKFEFEFGQPAELKRKPEFEFGQPGRTRIQVNSNSY